MRLKSHPGQEKHAVYLASSVNKGAVGCSVLAVSGPKRRMGQRLISYPHWYSAESFHAENHLCRKTKCYFNIRPCNLMV